MKHTLAGLFLSLLLLSGCDNKETSADPTPTTPSTRETTPPSQPEPSQPEPTLPEPQNTLQEERALEQQIAQVLTPAQEEVAKRLEETNRELSERLSQTAQEGNDKIQETLETTASMLEASTKNTPAKAQACASCHGNKGEKVALGRSKIMNEMSPKAITEALLGYQNDTYGGTMKAMMQTQVRSLTKEEIEELAAFYGKEE